MPDPGRVPIAFSYDVYTEDHELPAESIAVEDAPSWLKVSRHIRAEEPERFVLDEGFRAVAPDEVLEILDAMPGMYAITIEPNDRPEEDVHVQFGIQVAAALAESVDGVVVDRLGHAARDAESFGETCEPEIENHVGFAVEKDDDGGAVIASHGMPKFGFAEIEMDIAGLDLDLAEVAARVVDTVCTGLMVEVFTIGGPVEIADRRFQLDARDGGLVLSYLDGDLESLLREIADGDDDDDDEDEDEDSDDGEEG